MPNGPRWRNGAANAATSRAAIPTKAGTPWRPGSNANTAGLMDAPFGAIRPAAGVQAPALLKTLALYPVGHAAERAQAYLRNYGERMMLAGGAWYSGLDAGLNALCLSHARDHASATVGARPAFMP